MIQLKAILVESGRAFVQKDGRYQHWEPPYTLDTLKEVALHDIEEATTGYGFKLIEDMQFSDFSSLADYLINAYKDWKVKEGKPTEEIDDLEMLHDLPIPTFKRFVKKLQADFDNGKRWQVAVMATEMLNTVFADKLVDEIKVLQVLIDKCTKQVANKISSVFVNEYGVYGSQLLNINFGGDGYGIKVAPQLELIA